MRTLTTSIVLLALTSFGLKEQKEVKGFRITIDETIMTGHSYYEITSDTIKIKTKYYSPKLKTTEFEKALNKDEEIKIEKAVSRLKIKRLKDSYFGKDVSDDNYKFEFTFDINGTYKKTTIYEYKHKDIFELVRQINLLLPKDYLINYDDKYCRDR